MKHKIGILAVVVATILGTAACGGGGATQTAAGSAAAASGGAGAMPAAESSMAPADDMAASPTEDMAAGSEEPMADGAADDMGGGKMAAGVPQITVMEKDEGNDGDMAKMPQGMTLAKAKAAGLGKDGVQVVSVVGTDTSCIPDKTKVKAGKIWIQITNKGKKITEAYLESAKGDELVEVENIKTNQAGAIKTTVKKGSYLIACEPGMADKQIRTPLTVEAGM